MEGLGEIAEKEGSLHTHVAETDLGVSDFGDRDNYQLVSMNALDILREAVRILRFNCSSFMLILGLLICPVSAVFLTNVLVDESLVKRLSVRLLLVMKSSGVPLRPFIEHMCHRVSETAVGYIMCFPLFVTLSLLSKAAVVYSVDCSYCKRNADGSKFLGIVCKIWKRVVSTYLWSCMVIIGCLTLFSFLLLGVCSLLMVIGFSPKVNLYAAGVVGLMFSVVFANSIIICNVSVVVSVLEDNSGPKAMLRSSGLIKGQLQVGLSIFLGSTIGMAFVEGLFDHRVKTLSYGDGSSRIWEGPLLVAMYSFLVLIDSMATTVFYFSCRSYWMEAASQSERETMLETIAISTQRTGDVQ